MKNTGIFLSIHKLSNRTHHCINFAFVFSVVKLRFHNIITSININCYINTKHMSLSAFKTKFSTEACPQVLLKIQRPLFTLKVITSS